MLAYVLTELRKACWKTLPTMAFATLPLIAALVIMGIGFERGVEEALLSSNDEVAFFVDNPDVVVSGLVEELERDPAISDVRMMDPVDVKKAFFKSRWSDRELEPKLHAAFFPSIVFLKLSQNKKMAGSEAISAEISGWKERFPVLVEAIGLTELREIRYAGYILYGFSGMMIVWLFFIVFYVSGKRLLTVIRSKRDKIELLRCYGIPEPLIALPFQLTGLWLIWVPLGIALLVAGGFLNYGFSAVSIPTHAMQIAGLGLGVTSLIIVASVTHYAFRSR